MITQINKKFSISEIKVLLVLAVPLVVTGFIESSVGFFSTLFLAHLGPQQLAAGAIVSWIFVTMMVILWGALTSVSVIVAQKHGEKNDKAVGHAVRDGLLLALIFIPPASLLLWYMAPILLLLGQDPDTVALAQEYMHGLVWGVFPDFIGLVLMQFLIGLGHTRSNLVFALLWVPLNIFCNYVLIFGKFGAPALGIVGIGWGTTLAYWISTLALMGYLLLNKRYTRYLPSIFEWKTPTFLRELWQIGIPMGAMYCIEIAFFMTLTLFMGKLGSEILAANQITLQYMGLLSVFTFAMAQAITVRMGHTIGANSFDLAVRAAYIGISLTLFFMSIVASIYWFLPDFLIGFDLDIHDSANAEIIRYTKHFFEISAVFQLLEAARFGFFGALRGLKDTRFTLLTSIISFWGVSFPIGYVLAMHFNYGGLGFWTGIIFGEIMGVALLYARFNYKIKNINKIHDRAVLTQQR
jgi:multidrug resistance protein, MATE family